MRHNYFVTETLLTDKTAYLLQRPSIRNPNGYGLYVGNQILVGRLTALQFYVIRNVVKVNKNNKKITLNLSLVRQLHGKHFIKQQYKILKNGNRNQTS